MVQGCTHTRQTFWTEDEFTVTSSPGIRNRDVRVVEILVRDLEKTKPDKWGCVQTRELWSPQEERQLRPGHFWLLKFGQRLSVMSGLASNPANREIASSSGASEHQDIFFSRFFFNFF